MQGVRSSSLRVPARHFYLKKSLSTSICHRFKAAKGRKYELSTENGLPFETHGVTKKYNFNLN
jgi:hypothetical protein